MTVYVTPSTKQILVDYAHKTRQSTGEVISTLMTALGKALEPGGSAEWTPEAAMEGWKPVAPGPDKGASLPSLAGQPGVEHRAAAVSAPRSAAAVRTTANAIATSQPDVFYDHPGWKLSATGQNVCTRCGKTKIRSKNASCTAPA